jgi:TonB family protein
MTAFYRLSVPVPDHPVGLNRMVLLSLILHALALCLVFFLAPSIPSPKWTFGPVYSVQLVNMPDHFLQDRPAAKSLQKETLPAELDRIPVVPKKQLEMQKKPAGTVEKAIDEIRKKLMASEDRKQEASAKPANDFNTSTAAGDTELDRRMRPYYGLIWSRIKGQWALPQGIMPKENIEAVINAQILRNGVLAEATFEKRSGNRYFDESAMRAIQKASPFPPLPEWIAGASVEVGVRFHSSELR